MAYPIIIHTMSALTLHSSVSISCYSYLDSSQSV